MRQTYYVIDNHLCCRCGACQKVCPHGALTTASPVPVIDQTLCRLGAVTRPYELYQLKKGRRLL